MIPEDSSVEQYRKQSSAVVETLTAQLAGVCERLSRFCSSTSTLDQLLNQRKALARRAKTREPHRYSYTGEGTVSSGGPLRVGSSRSYRWFVPHSLQGGSAGGERSCDSLDRDRHAARKEERPGGGPYR